MRSGEFSSSGPRTGKRHSLPNLCRSLGKGSGRHTRKASRRTDGDRGAQQSSFFQRLGVVRQRLGREAAHDRHRLPTGTLRAKGPKLSNCMVLIELAGPALSVVESDLNFGRRLRCIDLNGAGVGLHSRCSSRRRTRTAKALALTRELLIGRFGCLLGRLVVLPPLVFHLDVHWLSCPSLEFFGASSPCHFIHKLLVQGISQGSEGPAVHREAIAIHRDGSVTPWQSTATATSCCHLLHSLPLVIVVRILNCETTLVAARIAGCHFSVLLLFLLDVIQGRKIRHLQPSSLK
mmetsp:Transcript_33401/g.73048  ORF Transcript_33401/g.73048 Transcript_33401/m.73048 type:complete len:291 (-) Transcript_33401:57-929(-)